MQSYTSYIRLVRRHKPTPQLYQVRRKTIFSWPGILLAGELAQVLAMTTFRVAISTAPDTQGSGRVDIYPRICIVWQWGPPVSSARAVGTAGTEVHAG